jgi:hypothetical protein
MRRMALSAGDFLGKEGAEEGVTLEAVKVEGNGMGNGENDRLEPVGLGDVGAHSVLLGGSRSPYFSDAAILSPGGGRVCGAAEIAPPAGGERAGREGL